MNTNKKIHKTFAAFQPILEAWRANNETIVFTNGCFDIIHHGHVDSLQRSAALGTKLIVGLNSDKSVLALKGENRPIMEEQGRAIIIAAFGFVDAVIIFEEETPAELITKIIPDVLVKGKEYKIHEIAGHETVLANGGKVKTLKLVKGISTSDLIKKINCLD